MCVFGELVRDGLVQRKPPLRHKQASGSQSESREETEAPANADKPISSTLGAGEGLFYDVVRPSRVRNDSEANCQPVSGAIRKSPSSVDQRQYSRNPAGFMSNDPPVTHRNSALGQDLRKDMKSPAITGDHDRHILPKTSHSRHFVSSETSIEGFRQAGVLPKRGKKYRMPTEAGAELSNSGTGEPPIPSSARPFPPHLKPLAGSKTRSILSPNLQGVDDEGPLQFRIPEKSALTGAPDESLTAQSRGTPSSESQPHARLTKEFPPQTDSTDPFKRQGSWNEKDHVHAPHRAFKEVEKLEQSRRHSEFGKQMQQELDEWSQDGESSNRSLRSLPARASQASPNPDSVVETQDPTNRIHYGSQPDENGGVLVSSTRVRAVFEKFMSEFREGQMYWVDVSISDKTFLNPSD